MATSSCSLHPRIFDATWWRDRIGAMDRVPRHLLVFPRPECALPGAEAAELWLRAHDGVRLRGLLARSLLCPPRPELRLDLRTPAEDEHFDWQELTLGRAELIFGPPPSRRLEDRVLDLIRMAQAARSLVGMGDSPVRLVTCAHLPPPDEILIAERLLGEGWV